MQNIKENISTLSKHHITLEIYVLFTKVLGLEWVVARAKSGHRARGW